MTATETIRAGLLELLSAPYEQRRHLRLILADALAEGNPDFAEADAESMREVNEWSLTRALEAAEYNMGAHFRNDLHKLTREAELHWPIDSTDLSQIRLAVVAFLLGEPAPVSVGFLRMTQLTERLLVQAILRLQQPVPSAPG